MKKERADKIIRVGTCSVESCGIPLDKHDRCAACGIYIGREHLEKVVMKYEEWDLCSSCFAQATDMPGNRGGSERDFIRLALSILAKAKRGINPMWLAFREKYGDVLDSPKTWVNVEPDEVAAWVGDYLAGKQRDAKRQSNLPKRQISSKRAGGLRDAGEKAEAAGEVDPGAAAVDEA